MYKYTLRLKKGSKMLKKCSEKKNIKKCKTRVSQVSFT